MNTNFQKENHLIQLVLSTRALEDFNAMAKIAAAPDFDLGCKHALELGHFGAKDVLAVVEHALNACVNVGFEALVLGLEVDEVHGGQCCDQGLNLFWRCRFSCCLFAICSEPALWTGAVWLARFRGVAVGSGNRPRGYCFAAAAGVRRVPGFFRCTK